MGSVWQKCSRHDLSEYPFLSGGGVCPYCLHERLSSLCPDCIHDLPCLCTPRASISSGGGNDALSSGIGSVGRVSNLIESEPSFRRSKTTGLQFLWFSKPKPVSETGSSRRRSLWRMFRRKKGERKTMMKKSKSVAVSDAGEMKYSPAAAVTRSKGNGWYFPSPIKVFRQSKMIFKQRFLCIEVELFYV